MTEHRSQNRNIKPRMIAGVFFFLIYTPLVLFITSGKLDWWLAWVYSLLTIVLSLGSRFLMARKHPDLVVERASFRDAKGVKDWDRKLVPWVAQFIPMIILVIAGLDKRFGWSLPIPLWLSLTALFVAILGYIFSTWALIENRFFSSVVRIQTERGHTVCDTGPYKVVRHPGYAGSLIWFVMTPLIFGSIWAYIPTVIEIMLIVLRTSLEDNTLQTELPGYQSFTQQTRYRLVPGIW